MTYAQPYLSDGLQSATTTVSSTYKDGYELWQAVTALRRDMGGGKGPQTDEDVEESIRQPFAVVRRADKAARHLVN